MLLVVTLLPSCFVLSGDYLYWTDWIEREVGRVDKHNGTRRTVILEQLPDLMGIKAVNISAVEGLFQLSLPQGLTMTARNHDNHLGEIYPMMLNDLSCTFGVSFSRFHCCGRRGHCLWPSWYRPVLARSASGPRGYESPCLHASVCNSSCLFVG